MYKNLVLEVLEQWTKTWNVCMVTKDKNRPKLGMYVYQGQGQIGINVYDYGECQGRILGLWKSTLAYVLFDIAERVELKSAQTILASIYTPPLKKKLPIWTWKKCSQPSGQAFTPLPPFKRAPPLPPQNLAIGPFIRWCCSPRMIWGRFMIQERAEEFK